MGRRKRWAEDMQARFEEGTFAKIAQALRLEENRTDFVRTAVMLELRRREEEKLGLESTAHGQARAFEQKRR
jgi:hypothetical protein